MFRNVCPCDHCISQGKSEQKRDCIYWEECNREGGRHGSKCRCFPKRKKELIRETRGDRNCP